MKKFLITFLIVSSQIFAQNITAEQEKLILEIAGKISKDLSKEITLLLETEENLDKANKILRIKFEPLRNQHDEITIVSYELSKNLANLTNREINRLKAQKIKFFKGYQIYFSGENTQQNYDYDFTMNGNYQLTDNSLILNNLYLTENKEHNPSTFHLKNFEYKSPDLPKLRNIDRPEAQLKIKQFFSLEKSNDLLKPALFIIKDLESLELVEKTGENFKLKFDKNYLLFWKLPVQAYSYLFYYDNQSPDIYLLYPPSATENRKKYTFKTGLVIDRKQNKSATSQILLVISSEKIPFENLFDKKIESKEQIQFTLFSNAKLEYLIKFVNQNNVYVKKYSLTLQP